MKYVSFNILIVTWSILFGLSLELRGQISRTFPGDLRRYHCLEQNLEFLSGRTLMIKQVDDHNVSIVNKLTGEEFPLGQFCYAQSVSMASDKTLALLNIRKFSGGGYWSDRMLLISDDDRPVPLEELIFETMDRDFLKENKGRVVRVINVGDIREFPEIDLYVAEGFPIEGAEYRGQQLYQYYRTWQRWDVVEQDFIRTLDEEDMKKYDYTWMKQLMYAGVRLFTDS